MSAGRFLPTFLAEELAALMVGKGREDLVFTAPEGGVLRSLGLGVLACLRLQSVDSPRR